MKRMSALGANQGRLEQGLALLILLLGGLLLALDGDVFWDEPGYLYVAAYVSQPDFLLGTFQTSVTEPYFYFPKILHMLFLKGVIAVVGIGVTALVVIMAVYGVLMLGAMLLIHAILRRLLPDNPFLLLATALTAATPVVLYLTFKTLPEAPALFFVMLGLYAFIRSLEERPVLWTLVAALALTAMALNRHSVALLLVSFVIAAFLFPMHGVSRWLLVKRAAVTAVLSIGGTLAVLTALGIDFDKFLLANSLFEKEEPFVFRLVSTALELGMLWLVLPLAMLGAAAADRRKLGFFLTWFLLATAPLLLFAHLESRYLIQNLMPFAGLAALVLVGLRQRFDRFFTERARMRHSLVVGLTAVFLATNWIALRLMPAEGNIWQMRSLVADIQQEMGDDDYAILTPWAITDFYYLRFVYPDLPVYTVTDMPLNIMRLDEPHAVMADRFFENRKLRSLGELDRLPDRMLYLGYGETFMVANARTILNAIPGIAPEQVIPGSDFIDHLTTSWMWQHPEVAFTLFEASGHYQAYHVRVKKKQQLDDLARIPIVE